MNITSARYVQDIDGNNDIVAVVIDGVSMSVPINGGMQDGVPDNRHYKAILEWVAE